MAAGETNDRTADPFASARAAILPVALDAAAFEGFSRAAIDKAAGAAGLDAATARAAFPGGGIDLIDFWSARADATAAPALGGPHAPSRVRERVACAVEARLFYFAPHKEAARRAAAILAAPPNAPRAARLVWRASDAIWRALGDKSTDGNYYSKRAILSGVVAQTQARWLADDDPGFAATRAFLADRINDVMRFEKLKAAVSKRAPDPAAVVGALARLRHPRGRAG